MSATWFDQQKRSFADVKIDAANDNGISTTEFLEAAESLTTLFGMPLIASLDNKVAVLMLFIQMFSAPRLSLLSRVI